jgi:hypothetical protein
MQQVQPQHQVSKLHFISVELGVALLPYKASPCAAATHHSTHSAVTKVSANLSSISSIRGDSI